MNCDDVCIVMMLMMVVALQNIFVAWYSKNCNSNDNTLKHTCSIQTNKTIQHWNSRTKKYASDAVINTSTCNILATAIESTAATYAATEIAELTNKQKLGSRSNVVKWL